MSLPTSENSTDKKEKTQEDEKVHSANSWETADLGDKQRNEKFLRLMGASKKEHHGKIVIGEKATAHCRDKKAEAHLQEELEEQFSQGMEHRLAGGRKGHLGLGFHPEDKGDGVGNKDGGPDSADKSTEEKTAASSDSHTEKKTTPASEEPQKDTSDDHSREKDERKRESSDKDGEHDIKKLKFVKSSS
ncbi:hypothetical protein EGW08_016553 [Elysia chlorotica]|uniref:Small acidic protein n=1 Tax=Elysia chlorotica TaxID=188477 RepID=A0A3S1AYV7_ELYCH|nr:hypothetical protein EGW08_016553 [Elysia chlorotica]